MEDSWSWKENMGLCWSRAAQSRRSYNSGGMWLTSEKSISELGVQKW